MDVFLRKKLPFGGRDGVFVKAFSGASFYKSLAVADMGDRLATIGMGRKWGGAAVGAGFPLGPHLTQCGLG